MRLDKLTVKAQEVQTPSRSLTSTTTRRSSYICCWHCSSSRRVW
jgi:hypothetical protein